MSTAIRPTLSIVIPVYNEEGILPELYDRLTKVGEALGYTFELIFVNDGSKDRSREILSHVCSQDDRVKVIQFSRNFGHQIAITAGLDHASGDAVVVIDGDLQDPPEVIPRLVKKWQEGYEVVYAIRESREGDGLFKKLTAAIFYRLLGSFTRIEIPKDTGDFRLMSRRAVSEFRALKEKARFVRGLVSWIGFRQTGIAFARDRRLAGETKYPLRKMLRFALDAITSFSQVPLQMATYLGFVISIVCFGYIVYAILLKLLTDAPILGWASLIVAMLFLGGIQLITLGMIGEYVGRIYEEVKARPLYIIEELTGFRHGSEGAPDAER